MSRKVLLLNRGETFLDIIDWKVAVCIMVKSSAQKPFDYHHFHKIQISPKSAEMLTEEGKFEIHSEDDSYFFLLPSALVLTNYVHIPFRKATINLSNVLKRDNFKCGYCYRRLNKSNGTIDHILPSSRWKELGKKNGFKEDYANNWKNVVACCRGCNLRKDDRTPKEAGMTLNVKPFAPTRDYLVLKSMDSSVKQIWERWVQHIKL